MRAIGVTVPTPTLEKYPELDEGELRLTVARKVAVPGALNESEFRMPNDPPPKPGAASPVRAR